MNTFEMNSMRNTPPMLVTLLFTGSLVTACRTEAHTVESHSAEPPVEAPHEVATSSTVSESALDEVDVVSPVEALATATDEIDDNNLLDELDELEAEMSEN